MISPSRTMHTTRDDDVNEGTMPARLTPTPTTVGINALPWIALASPDANGLPVTPLGTPLELVKARSCPVFLFALKRRPLASLA